MSYLLVNVIEEVIETISDMDILKIEDMGDYYEILVETSCLDKGLAEIKSKLWALFHIPPRFVEVADIKEVHRGRIFKNVLITLRVKKRQTPVEKVQTLRRRRFRFFEEIGGRLRDRLGFRRW